MDINKQHPPSKISSTIRRLCSIARRPYSQSSQNQFSSLTEFRLPCRCPAS